MLRLLQLGCALGTVLMSQLAVASRTRCLICLRSILIWRICAAICPPTAFTWSTQPARGAELLAVYIYPVQVFFASRPGELAGMAGRRVRVSSIGQADFASAPWGRRP